jgi:hypothetical protein
MNKIQAVNYVRTNGRYSENSPNNKYFVRFPNPYGRMVFFSSDTLDLVEQIFRYSKSKEGKEKCQDRDWSKYNTYCWNEEEEYNEN